MRILIVKLSSIGDCLHASPVAQALRESLPNAFLAWVVEEHCAPVIQGNPYLDAVFIWHRKGRFVNLLRLARLLRSQHFDATLDLQGLFKSALLSRLTGAKVRVGPEEGREGARFFYTRLAPRQPRETHVVVRYLLRAAELGAKWERIPPYFMPCDEQDRAYITELLQSHCVQPEERLVALNPGVSRAIRQWYPERFAAVGDRLRRETGVRLLLTGSLQDTGLGQAVLDRMETAPEVVNLIGKTTLNQLAALYERCALFIGGDTGPMHIAQAMKTPVIALYGPSSPHRTGPLGPPHQVIYKQWHCSPCRYRICPIGKQCLQAISVEEVVHTASTALSRQEKQIS